MNIIVAPNRKNVEEILSLTPLQEGMLFHYLNSPDDNLYCEQLSLKLSGEIDLQNFRKAWDMVIETNEMLRTVFRWTKLKRPVQIVLKTHSLQFHTHDLSGLSPEIREQRLEEIKNIDRSEPFDLKQVPFRVTLIKETADCHHLIISNHHILYDGWSNGIILEEFFKAYDAISSGSTTTMRRWVKTKFRSFIHWSKNQVSVGQEEYWRAYLEGIDGSRYLPQLTFSSGCNSSGRICFRIGADGRNKIKNWVKIERVTQASFFYTAWGILLQRYSDRQDVVFGTTVSGRNADINGIENIVGLFINTLPLRVNEDSEIRSMVCKVNQELRERHHYENTPLVEINSYIGREGNQSFFDSLVVIENYPISSRLQNSGAGLSLLSFSMVESTGYDLTAGITMIDELEEIEVEFLYSSQRLDSGSVQRMGRHFLTIIEEMLDFPSKTARDIDLLSSTERLTLLETFNNTHVEFQQRQSLSSQIDRQSNVSPDSVALVSHSGPELVNITYKELSQSSYLLARRLRAMGFREHQLTGLLIDRSVEMVIAILAVLKAGGAYLPIDTEYPEERCRYILADSNVSLLIGSRDVIEENKKIRDLEDQGNIHIIYTDSLCKNRIEPALEAEPEWQPPLPENIAYVIYTSGSTGRPKGVMVEHRNLTAYVNAFLEEFSITRSSIVVQQASYAFDTFSEEVYPVLIRGGKLIVPCRDDVRDIYRFATVIATHSVTIIDCSPLLLDRLNQPLLLPHLSSVTCFISGGDLLRGEYVNRLLEMGQVYNTYGPTESTVCATFFKCNTVMTGSVPIGSPIANYQVFILDQFLKLTPPGVPGELCVGGAGVTRGYLNRPELTSEKFIHSPFDSNEKQSVSNSTLYGKKSDQLIEKWTHRGNDLCSLKNVPQILYRTGDRANWLPDGTLMFLGRIDAQVNIRGFRIEPGEIENQLLTYPTVCETAVTVREDRIGDPYICAYIVCDEESRSNGCINELLHGYLSDRLPAYMLPSFFVKLDQIPLNTSGKPDREALPPPQKNGALKHHIPPRNDTEKKLARIWAEILDIEQSALGIDTNFFQAGGHSLKAVSMVAAVHKHFDILIPLAMVFQEPTIRKLASKMNDSFGTKFVAIKPVEKKEYYPLSSSQKRLYFLKRLAEQSTAYNMTEILLVKGRVDNSLLTNNFQALIKRHESLRTSFLEVDDQPVQRIHDEIDLEVERISYFENDNWPPSPQWLSAKIRPFDLTTAPLFRVSLVSLKRDRHLLIIDMHHIISDGLSVEILIRDYLHIRTAGTLSLLPIQYKDFAHWQNKQKEFSSFKSQQKYWHEMFKEDIPALDLPLDFPRLPHTGGKGNSIVFQTESSQTVMIDNLAQSRKATRYMVMLAIFNIFLAKISQQDTIVVGTPVAGRRHSDLKQVVGMFINTLPLKNNPSGNQSFFDFLDQVKTNTLDAFENQDYPFEDLVEHVLKQRDTGRNPLFDVLFSLEKVENIETMMDDIQLEHYPYQPGTAKFDLSLEILEENNTLAWRMTYLTSLFKQDTVQRFMSGFNQMIKRVLETPYKKINQYSLLTTHEKYLILEEFNATGFSYPRHKTLHHLIKECSDLNPDRIALCGPSVAITHIEIQLSYKELNKRAGLLASHLRNMGIHQKTIVAIMMERSVEMIIAILGILKAACTYLPIDPEYPEERINYMIKDSGAEKLTDLLPENYWQNCYHISPPATSALKNSVLEVPYGSQPETAAYIIYTSGSTGKPKGVVVEHRSVVNLIFSQLAEFGIDQNERILQFSTIGFDASVEQIYTALISGAVLHLVSKATLLDQDQFRQFIRSNMISHIHAVPSFLTLLKVGDYPGLKRLIAGGDVCPPQLANQWSQYCDFYNEYGPTETTVTSTEWKASPDSPTQTVVPIGKPLGNTIIYIFDPFLNLLPPGIYGEMYIGGEGVSRGYLNRPELTAEKFVRVTDDSGQPQLMYRTGDKVRWLPDGNLQFAGRKDQQVKIRGFRIEIGEIEHQLLRHASVDTAAVVAREDRNNSKYLCAYVVPACHDIDTGILKEHLTALLPGYMVPAYFVLLDKIPKTASGKIDRKALPEPNLTAKKSYKPPANVLEKQLVDLWAEILDLKAIEISVEESFFLLGGHSLNATVMTSRIHKILNCKIPLSEVFITSTVRGLARYIKNRRSDRFVPIEPTEKRKYYPLSPAQKQLYVLYLMNKDSTNYNMSLALELEGKIVPKRLEATFFFMIDKHEGLRTSFFMTNDVPVQKVHESCDFEIEYYDHPITDVIENFIRPFDLEQVPLFRVGLIKIQPGKHLLLVDMHHIISDGVSTRNMIHDFIALYQGARPEKMRLHYRDYCQWLLRPEMKKELAKQEKFWLDVFSQNIPLLDLPTDFPRPVEALTHGRTERFYLDEAQTRQLKETARVNEATVFMMLMTIYNLFLSRLSNQQDIVIGTPVAGRRHADLEPVIGLFINTLPLRNKLDNQMSFTGVLKQVRQNAIAAFENQDYPFEDLVEHLTLDRESSRNPLFDTMFSLEVVNLDKEAERLTDLRIRNYPYEFPGTKFDMVLTAMENESRLVLELEYATALFEKETVLRFISYFKHLVASILANPGTAICNLNIIPETERKQLLLTFNNTAHDFPRDKTIPILIEEQTKKSPNAIALAGKTGPGPNGDIIYITYSELQRQSERKAQQLSERGICHESIVAIQMESSITMTIWMLAVMKAGGAYLPIDPAYPGDRIDYIIKDSCAASMISMQGIETFSEGVHTEGSATPDPASLAYIIYTSGSTGNPKGVAIEHLSFTNMCTWHNCRFSVTASDHAMKYAGVGFDASVWEIYPPLIAGASLYIPPEEIKLNFSALAAYIDKHLISYAFLPTQVCEQFIDNPNRSLRLLHTAGDKLKRWRPTPYKLINNYGPTENTVVASSFEVTRSYHNIPIGKPSGNSQIYILDCRHKLQPIGVPGELCIGGLGLARGYLNRPQLTADKFVQLSLHHSPFTVYKTGDLSRWLPDGNLEFLGRLDFQVKIRGFRIELGEIEYRLNLRKEVKEAVVISREMKTGDKYLCAYVSYNEEPLTTIQWREYLSGHLPEYMVPAYFVTLDSIPLNANGKVDRSRLPAPVITDDTQINKASTWLEKEIARLWSDLLEIPNTSLDTAANFFHLGGHSLKATVLASRVSKTFNVEFSMSHVFSGPTIKEMARYIEQSREKQCQSILKVEEKEYFPQSPAQKRIYILEQGENIGSVYHMPLLLEIIGSFDSEKAKKRLKEKLEMIFLILIHRHESLCTSFHLLENEPVQKVHALVDFILEIDRDPNNTPFTSIINSFVRPFPLEHAPLLRASLVRREPANPLLALDIHHIVGDGISTAILAEEFLKIYNGEHLPALTFRYKDFASWQYLRQKKGYMDEQISYWLDRFDNGADTPSLNLPVDFPRPGTFDFRGDSISFRLDRQDMDAFIATGLKIKKGVTLFMNIMAAFSVLLYKYTGQNEIVIGGTAAGRSHNELQRIVGVFVNTLPFRSDIDGTQNYLDFLEMTRSHCLAAFEHQDVPFDTLVEKLNIRREPSRNPIFDVFLSVSDFQDSGMAMKVGHQIQTADGLVFSLCNWETPGAKFDLSLDAELTEQGIEFTLEYYVGIFKRSTAERITRHLKDTIRAISRVPHIPLERLDILSRQERKQILFQFNDTAGEYPEFLTLHGIFEDRAAWVADRIAVTGGNRENLTQLTYNELNRRAAELAVDLRREGVTTGDIVAVCMEPSIEIMTVLLGILKAGAAYLPIVPDTPEQRISYMLADSSAKCMITTEGEKEDRRLIIHRLYAETRYSPVHDQPRSSADHTAYIIYTSGTTGKPKGVMIEHRSFVNRITWVYKRFQFDRHDVVLQKTAISFDVSMCEFFRWIPGGGRMFIMENKDRKDLDRMLWAIATHCITVCEFIPSLLNVFLDHLIEENQWPSVRTLRWVFAGAEAISPIVAEKFNITLKRQFGTRLINAYGPTEATVDVTHYDCSNLDSAHITSTPIGFPIQNTRIYILGSKGEIQPVGIAGELCIAGKTLARGYLNNPGLTAEKFTHIDRYAENVDRFSRRFLAGNGRLYRTGDLARWMPGGVIEFMGRIDRQVKLRGFRIELGEIEAQLLTHPSINEAFVVPHSSVHTEKVLCAYVVSLENKPPTPMEIKLHLSRRLPVYMVPSYFMLLDSLPRTANGKIDEAKLPLPSSNALVREYQPPRNEDEKTILAAWAPVLKLDPASIGIFDEFFNLGGDSLKVIQVCSRLCKSGLKVNVEHLYSHQTISSLSAFIELSRHSALPKGIKDLISYQTNQNCELADVFVPHEIEADLERMMEKNLQLCDTLMDNIVMREYPVSPVQLCSLLLSDHRGLERHNLLTIYHFDGMGNNRDTGERSELEEIRRLISQLIYENTLLRSVIVGYNKDVDGHYSIREFASLSKMPLPFIDLSGYMARAKFGLLNIINNQLMQPMNIIESLLYRIVVVKWEQHRYKIVFAVNHLIFDGGSVRLLPEKMKDIQQRQHSGFKTSKTVEPRVDYYDYCSFMNRIDYRHIQLNPFIDINHYKANIIRASCFFDKSANQAGNFELNLSCMKPPMLEYYNEILLLAYSYTIAELFHTRPAPISSISYGRHYRGGNFGNIIGDFHDFIPVFFSTPTQAKHVTQAGRQSIRNQIRKFLDFKQYINDSNLSFISYFISDREIRDDIKYLVSPFSFNSLIGLFEEVAGQFSLTSVKKTSNENNPSNSSNPEQWNNLKPKYFDLELVREPDSERLWISINHNSTFDFVHIQSVLYRHFKTLVDEGNRHTGGFLP